MPGARLVACVAASWTNIELYYKIFDTLFLTHWPSVSPSRGLGFKDSVILSITLSIALLHTQTLVDCAAVWRTRLQFSVIHLVTRVKQPITTIKTSAEKKIRFPGGQNRNRDPFPFPVTGIPGLA
jgi:hypothetical protein